MEMQQGGEMAMTALGVAIALGTVLAIRLIVIVIVCVITADAFRRLPPEFRLMDPSMVWLLMVPCFWLIWNFFVFPRLSASYRNYFESIGRPDVGSCGEGLALAYSICAACTVIPCLWWVAVPSALVLLIVFLLEIHRLKKWLPAVG